MTTALQERHQAQPMARRREDDGRPHDRVVVNGVGLHYVHAGAGFPVVLLHGFPEFWYSWRHQIAALSACGFHTLAPDLRGYNESDKPTGVANYRLGTLVRDVAAFIEAAGQSRAVVIGHDWGGLLAWRLAMTRPDLVERLVVLNAPHPAAYLRELGNPMQWLRSSYMALFQLPWLPERLLSARNFAVLERAFRTQPVRRGAFTDADIEQYKRAFAQPGALTAALNYYRALARYPDELRGVHRVIRVPTLHVWGERDPYLDRGLTRGLDRWVPGIRVVRLPDASHWVQNDAPERVNQLLLAFLHDLAGGSAR